MTGRDPIEAAVLRAIDRCIDITGDAALARIIDDPAADLDFDLLEIDSLEAAQICISIEDETGFPCDVAHLQTHRSLKALAALIRHERGLAPGG
jgi:acyl carrier protein